MQTKNLAMEKPCQIIYKIMCTIGPMIKSSSVMMFSYSLFILFQVEGKLEPGVEKKGFHIKQLPFQSMGLVLERKYLVA